MTNMPAVSEPVRLEIVPHKIDLEGLAVQLVDSGMFGKGNRNEIIPAIMAKAMLGAELGLDPVQSQLLIHVVEGKPEVSGKLIGQLIKRHPRYDYRPLMRTNETCVLQFFDADRPCGRCEERGWLANDLPCPSCTNEFSIQDAATAGVAHKNNWKHYPRAMLFNRCISEGYKVFCPDALRLPTYTPTELDARSPLAIEGPGPCEAMSPMDTEGKAACCTLRSGHDGLHEAADGMSWNDPVDTAPAPQGSRPCEHLRGENGACLDCGARVTKITEPAPKLEIMDA